MSPSNISKSFSMNSQVPFVDFLVLWPSDIDQPLVGVKERVHWVRLVVLSVKRMLQLEVRPMSIFGVEGSNLKMLPDLEPSRNFKINDLIGGYICDEK